jgi:predicted naringenin-chalcone synthase
MTTLLAIERYLPPYRYDQEEVTGWVRAWLEEKGGASAARLLSVYTTAGVKRRGSVVPIEEVFAPRDFERQNDRYIEIARVAGVELARRALERAELRPADIDLVVSVSCTGLMIPAVDAYVADALGMGPRLARLPITESGCAGGVVALARAGDFLAAHPDRCALVISLEFASLTFQRWDRSSTNVVSTAIFGDGGAAVVLAGREHPRARGAGLARLAAAESVFFAGTTHLMGFRLRNPGLQIVLDRELAPFVRREVAAAVKSFLEPHGLRRDDVTRWILHPGGRRIIEVMSERLGLSADDLAPTEAVLAEHGNMSSVTVLFVLDEILRTGRPRPGERGVLGAFGPGFGAEFALLEFL